MNKKLLAGILAFLMLFTIMPSSILARALSDKLIPIAYKDGAEVFHDNIEWNYDESAAVLSFSGAGSMPAYTTNDYSKTSGAYLYNEIPWYSYNSTVKEIVFGDGITAVGTNSDGLYLVSPQKLQNVRVENGNAILGKRVVYFNKYHTEPITINAYMSLKTFETSHADWAMSVNGNLSVKYYFDETQAFIEKYASLWNDSADLAEVAWTEYQTLDSRIQKQLERDIPIGKTETYFNILIKAAGITCGRINENILYIIDGDALYIKGEGELPVFSSSAPWAETKLETADVDSGITKITAGTFSDNTELAVINISNSEANIETGAFPATDFTLNTVYMNSPVGKFAEKNNIKLTVDTLRFLLIGNSHTVDYSTYLSQTLADMGLDTTFQVEIVQTGSIGLFRYTDRTTNSQTMTQSGRIENGNYDNKILASKKTWDVVVLQDFMESVALTNSDDFINGLKSTIALVKDETRQPGAKIGWFSDWVDFDSSSANAWAAGSEESGFANSERTFAAVKAANIVDFIIPGATIVRNARISALENENMTSLNNSYETAKNNIFRDRTHMTDEYRDKSHIGRYLAAAGAAEAIVKAFRENIKGTVGERSFKPDNVTQGNASLARVIAKMSADNPNVQTYAKLNNTYYKTLSEAAASAKAGDILEIYGVCKYDSNITLASGITVKTYAGNQNHTVVLDEGGNINQNGLIANPGYILDGGLRQNNTAAIASYTGEVTTSGEPVNNCFIHKKTGTDAEYLVLDDGTAALGNGANTAILTMAKEITVPSVVTYFEKWKNIRTFKVSKIKSNAFLGCSQLEKIYIEGDVLIEANALNGLSSDVKFITSSKKTALELQNKGILPTNIKFELAEIKYVALGDGVATGYALEEYNNYDNSTAINDDGDAFRMPENSFAAMAGNAFDNKYGRVVTDNQAVSGWTSKDLLSALNSGDFDDVLKDADVVTVTIGANDLLVPFIDEIVKIVNEEFAKTSENVTVFNKNNLGFNFPAQYQNSLEEFIIKLGNVNQKINTVLGYNEQSASYYKPFLDVCKQFKEVNQPGILKALKQKAPNAKIYWTTLYNPFYGEEININLLFPDLNKLLGTPSIANTLETVDLAALCEVYIKEMNEAFVKNTEECTAVDLYNAFNVKGMTNADISRDTNGTDINLKDDSLHFDIDPHPNSAGHKLIYEIMMNVINQSFAMSVFEENTANVDAIALLGLYDKVGKLVSYQSLPIKTAAQKVPLKFEYKNVDYSTSKVMVWNGFDNIKPLLPIK